MEPIFLAISTGFFGASIALLSILLVRSDKARLRALGWVTAKERARAGLESEVLWWRSQYPHRDWRDETTKTVMYRFTPPTH